MQRRDRKEVSNNPVLDFIWDVKVLELNSMAAFSQRHAGLYKSNIAFQKPDVTSLKLRYRGQHCSDSLASSSACSKD